MKKKLVNVQLLLDCVISSDGDNVYQLRLPNGQVAHSSYTPEELFAFLDGQFKDVAENLEKAVNQPNKAD